ncbi:protein V57 [Gallid alphaherpesvirus 1]|uniref:Protein V57 n=1 Tax=Infectious laryngotracheitis virus TaxID=10386 RepID=L7SUV4_ILTV|nr:protein V57 [Gallid alphaherpesvirus 1]AGC23172.1 protein V57 [Gallid alphaherpesvirus 1]ATD84202.1 protein V57 [Gallid alphaherpesvirus 1]ATD84281.1 protein V57 [Gallid alphaherpesvirus 1]ATD84360.1 protein V57 [Gallid alphaherpesvirus 1]
MKYGQAAIATDMDFARMSRQPPRKNSRCSSARTAALQGNGYCFLPKSESCLSYPLDISRPDFPHYYLQLQLSDSNYEGQLISAMRRNN